MIEKLFGFNPKETTVRTEIMAGITTFLTMAYILAVNPNILGETGMDKGALFTTTVLMAALPTIFMGLYAKLPLALAPGMGLNAFFAYTVCLVMGYSWQFALTAVFLEGLAFILLTVTNLREKIVDVIPAALKTAISAGIGLYIAFIGLKNAEVIVDNPATLVCLGKLTSGSGLLGIIGIAITSILLVRNVKGALLIGILATTIIGIPMGITNIDGILDVHHIHIWSLDGQSNYATMHIATDADPRQIKRKVREELRENNIIHATLELETSDEQCPEEHCHRSHGKPHDG